MKVLRQIGQFKLNEGDGMAKGLYNVTNGILLENTKGEGVSFWFDKETKDNLMLMDDFDFGQRCKELVGNDINRFV